MSFLIEGTAHGDFALDAFAGLARLRDGHASEMGCICSTGRETCVREGRLNLSPAIYCPSPRFVTGSLFFLMDRLSNAVLPTKSSALLNTHLHNGLSRLALFCTFSHPASWPNSSAKRHDSQSRSQPCIQNLFS